jgi:pullulanase/glycogen debranching enzyme
MVRSLHAAGIEVILDVVYNHTAEGNHMGPTLSFRGIDNAAYYRLVADDPRYYMDYTGCGNTLNVMNPRVLQLIMDSLRYWITEMHVDGFRFDLASALARELHAVDKLGAFFDIIHQDPIISQVKLIAEPWDLGEGGYMVANFPVQWSEWNAKYRDCVRSFWKGDGGSGFGVCHAVLRQQRSVCLERPASSSEHQFRDLPRRFHSGRPGLLRPQAQRGEWRRESRWCGPQHQLELRRRRSHEEPADPGLARPQETFHAWRR